MINKIIIPIIGIPITDETFLLDEILIIINSNIINNIPTKINI